MSSFETKDMMSSLEKKGFVKRDGDHHFFDFFYKGQKTRISTKISHGSDYKQYRGKLFNLVKKQLKFVKNIDLVNFAKCTLGEDEYIKILQDQGILSKDDQEKL
ncbi:hypothetical protein EHQ43_10060 [Leptospira bouyouniensis]|uniref:Type II toxin-antitoxin system HicA family toxin n=1 Tax=Leptospira bouyouniensis TaxID=2484911 RepID=A0A7I0HRL8_9LEPT|nr:hypothetical protein [Leptospira bouyouniensis]TGL04979.1 hypothetical protein EHQ43_10060 [Leptospira bouyouniensis]